MNKYLVKLLAPIGVLALIAAAWSLAPPPRPASAQFVDQATYGGTSGGTANAQTITVGNYTSHQAGVVLRFLPGNTNTGPMTINVTSLGNVAVVRPSSIGPVALSGSEILSGELTCVIYNGTAYQLGCNIDMTRIGDTVDYRGAATPRGTLVEDGSCVSRTTFAPLFSVIGTTYNVCDGSTTFGVPDSRGTGFMALDGQGVNGLANRITTATCATPNAVGICGLQTQTLTASQIPSISVSVTSALTTIPSGGVFGGSFNQTGGFGFGWTSAPAVSSIGSSGSSTNTGGAAHPILPPMSFGRRAIKY